MRKSRRSVGSWVSLVLVIFVFLTTIIALIATSLQKEDGEKSEEGSSQESSLYLLFNHKRV